MKGPLFRGLCSDLFRINGPLNSMGPSNLIYFLNRDHVNSAHIYIYFYIYFFSEFKSTSLYKKMRHIIICIKCETYYHLYLLKIRFQFNFNY
jgi:hypothetical protein